MDLLVIIGIVGLIIYLIGMDIKYRFKNEERNEILLLQVSIYILGIVAFLLGMWFFQYNELKCEV